VFLICQPKVIARNRLVKGSPGARAGLNRLVTTPTEAGSCFKRLVKRQKNVG